MDASIKIMQGDQYPIPITITDQAGTIITDVEVRDVEIIIGNYRKTMPEITFNAETGAWEFPLTQQETFRFNSQNARVQVRVAFSNGDVVGVETECIVVVRSASKEVL